MGPCCTATANGEFYRRPGNRAATLPLPVVRAGVEFLDNEDVDPDEWTGFTITF